MSLVVCGTEAMQDKLELYIAAADGDVELGTAAWREYYTKAKKDAGVVFPCLVLSVSLVSLCLDPDLIVSALAWI